MRAIVMVVIVIAAALTLGCETVSEMREVQGQTEKAADQLWRDTGTRPQIGFNVNNGRLAVVNVTFSSREVSNRRVSELEEIVRRALMASLAEQPQRLIVSVESTGVQR
jgi:hypothetical protein